MKSQPPVAHRRLPYRGFTLMELLIVMVIIGILAALTIGAFRFAQEKAAKDRTVSAHATIRVALEQYKEKAGEYPEPASPNEEDKFTGHTMKIGGAHMLYQAISGDGTSAIHFQAVPPGGGGESNGQVDDLERDNVVSSTPLPKSMISPSNATV